MNIRNFVLKHREFCNRYNIALDLYYRCSEYLEDEKRTTAEVDKYIKKLNAYTVMLSGLIQEYKKLNGEELCNRITINGFILYDKVS